MGSGMIGRALCAVCLMLTVAMTGCMGQKAAPNSTALSPAQALAKQQAILSNPHVSPMMKDAVRRQMQQEQAGH